MTTALVIVGIIGWTVVVVLFAVIGVLLPEYTRVRSRADALAKDVARLSADLVEHSIVLNAERESRQIAMIKALDGKTQSLIRLAASNTTQSEATSAAMVACRRLKKALDT